MLFFIALLIIINIALTAYRIPEVREKTKKVFTKKPFVIEYEEEITEEEIKQTLKSFGL